MSDLRTAAQQALKVLESHATHGPLPGRCPVRAAEYALRAALERQEATGKESLQVEQRELTVKESLTVPQHIADQLTTADLAWLETRRLVRVWKELGQMRWVGADDGWDRAIEAVRARLDKECQDVLAWKEKVEASEQTAAQLLQKLRGMKDE
jgi:hypothetical protein